MLAITSCSKLNLPRYYLSSEILSYTDSPSILKGYYVYEWTDARRPFYIGMGHSRRAWNQHLPHVEERRYLASAFRVRIVAHGLSKRLAHQYERSHIIHRTRQGFVLANKRIPQC